MSYKLDHISQSNKSITHRINVKDSILNSLKFTYLYNLILTKKNHILTLTFIMTYLYHIHKTYFYYQINQ